jgi:hypothetical protein
LREKEEAMAKAFLFVLSVIGLTVLVSGQTVATPQAVPRILTANRIQKTGPNTFQALGTVRIEIGTVVITADEADYRTGDTGAAPIDFDLRGNVHVTAVASK